jgi:hypothetical protein
VHEHPRDYYCYNSGSGSHSQPLNTFEFGPKIKLKLSYNELIVSNTQKQKQQTKTKSTTNKIKA